MKEVLRETKGLCPYCRRKVDSKVSEENNRIFLSKFCPQHGMMQEPLAQNTYYRKIEEFYFPLISTRNRKEGATELIVTFKCNMNCPVCYLGDFQKELINFAPTIEELKNFIETTKDKTFILSGGEPTCREDLFDIIRLLKKYKKTVGMNTNGLKLVDMEYVKALKKAGIDEISIQFSGFNSNAEEYLRGKDYIQDKLKALQNLKTIGIPTRINALIAGGINEEEVIRIMNYALNNSFIKMVNFGALLFVGWAADFPREQYLMPDDILRIAEENTSGKINRENVYLFKKLEIALSSLINKSTCLYYLTSLAIRTPQGYETIDKYINLKGIEHFLDRYQKLYKYNKGFARIYLILFSPIILILYTHLWKIFKEFFLTVMAFLFKGNYFSKSDKFLYFLFTVECDPNRMDYAIHRNCPRKSILFFNRTKCGFVRTKEPIESTNWLLWR